MSDFWALVERARADATDDGVVVWASGSAIGAALVERLMPLAPEQIAGFHRCFTHAVDRAHQWELCAAAFVIWDYISDDGFSDFKAGLVGLGRDVFERVVAAEADALADLPMVRGVAAGDIDRFVLGAEAIQNAAAQAYERCTGDAEGFWEALDSMPADEKVDRAGKRWSGQFGSPEDAGQIPVRLPRLYELFATRASASR